MRNDPRSPCRTSKTIPHITIQSLLNRPETCIVIKRKRTSSTRRILNLIQQSTAKTVYLYACAHQCAQQCRAQQHRADVLTVFHLYLSVGSQGVILSTVTLLVSVCLSVCRGLQLSRAVLVPLRSPWIRRHRRLGQHPHQRIHHHQHHRH